MSYYSVTRKQTVGSTTGEGLSNLADTLTAAGVAIPKSVQQAVQETRANLSRLQELRREAQPEAHLRAVEAKIADGTATVSDIMSAANARTMVTNDPTAAFAQMFNNAERIISKEAHEAFRAHGDKWITQTMRPVVNKHVATILDAAPETLRVDPDQDQKSLEFLHHIPAVAEAWGNLTTIYSMARGLRSLGITASTYQRDDCYEFDGDPAERDNMQDRNISWFVWAARKGHTPGIYTEADNNKHWS